MRKMVILLVASVFLLLGCNRDEVTTYTIARKGVVLSEENFDVIHVYGFSDNREVARQLTEYLNGSEPGTYHFYEQKE